MKTFTFFVLVALACGGVSAQDLLPGASAILRSVGSGHAALSLRSDWQQHFSRVQRDIGFEYIRFHGVLDDDMSTYLGGSANMFNVYSSLDFILSHGAKPIVELSFMPRELASDPSQTVFHYRGITSGPKSWADWSSFVTGFVQLLAERYSVAEVSTWRFEVWNEPNCGFLYPYGSGCCAADDCGPQQLYFELYNATSRAVKAAHPSFAVGGPATAQLGWLKPFLSFVRSAGAPIDFVSSHLYPTDPGVPQHRDGFASAVSAAAGVASSAGLPLLLTEFNAGLGIGVADGPYSAAFVLHQVAAFQEASGIEVLSFWCFTDIFEEQGQMSAPYTQAFGMMTNVGVPKPVYRAMQFVRALVGGTTASLPSSSASAPRSRSAAKRSGPLSAAKTAPSSASSSASASASSSASTPKARLHQAMVTSNNTLDTICTNHAMQGNTTEMLCVLVNFDVKGNPIDTIGATAFFSGLDSAFVPDYADVLFIDESSAFAEPVWVAAGSPMYPGRDEIENEMLASALVPLRYPVEIYGNNVFGVSVSLSPYASALVRLIYNSSLSE